MCRACRVWKGSPLADWYEQQVGSKEPQGDPMPEESTARCWEKEYVRLMDLGPAMRAPTTKGPARSNWKKSPTVAM